MIVKKRFKKLPHDAFEFRLTEECYDSLVIDTAVALLKHVISNPAPIYYGDLARKMTIPVEPIHLNKPLGCISEACRENRIPLLSAIVISKGTEMPGSGYFEYFYPNADEKDWLEIYLKDFRAVTQYKHWNEVLEVFEGK